MSGKRGLTGMFSYTYSSLWGNYTGLTTTDQSDGGSTGRNSPDTTRSFDEPFYYFGQNGKSNNGALPTDRPNVVKGYLYYTLPAYKRNRFTSAITRDWGLQSIVKAYSPPPVDVTINANQSFSRKPIYLRPDVISGVPFYLYGPQYPGGKIINNTPDGPGDSCIGPFCFPALDADGNVLNQGDLGRNAEEFSRFAVGLRSASGVSCSRVGKDTVPGGNVQCVESPEFRSSEQCA